MGKLNDVESSENLNFVRLNIFDKCGQSLYTQYNSHKTRFNFTKL
jgi:hypothetical protein